MKFRKKPVVIEAFEWTPARWASNEEWPNWLHEAWGKSTNEPGAFWPGESDFMLIHTLEGNHRVAFGDWIIRGVAGELYPCKPGIFAATYEPVEEGE